MFSVECVEKNTQLISANLTINYTDIYQKSYSQKILQKSENNGECVESGEKKSPAKNSKTYRVFAAKIAQFFIHSN